MAIDSGSTAFIIVSMALVNPMTPGLAFFYGGLVREKNVLTILMQNFVSMGLVTIIWVVWGFSLCFGESGVVIGNPSSHAMLTDMYKWDGTIPGLVFAGSSPSPPWAPTPSFPSPSFTSSVGANPTILSGRPHRSRAARSLPVPRAATSSAEATPAAASLKIVCCVGSRAAFIPPMREFDSRISKSELWSLRYRTSVLNLTTDLPTLLHPSLSLFHLQASRACSP